MQYIFAIFQFDNHKQQLLFIKASFQHLTNYYVNNNYNAITRLKLNQKPNFR